MFSHFATNSVSFNVNISVDDICLEHRCVPTIESAHSSRVPSKDAAQSARLHTVIKVFAEL